MTSTTRRSILSATAAVSALAFAPSALRAAKAGDAIRPFRIDIPAAALADLRRRIAATRWPDKETVSDQSQGVPLAKISRSCATGARTTTGGKWKRSSTRCRSS